MKPEILEHLHNNRDFALFCEEILRQREDAIHSLHEAPTDRVQQAAGRILACDEILTMARHEALREKWGRLTE